MERIVFIGGNANLPNFESRIIEEFDYYWRNNLNMMGDKSAPYAKLKSSKNFLHPVSLDVSREMICYKGLYLLSHIMQEKDFITKAEYSECGALQALKRKNINKLALI